MRTAILLHNLHPEAAGWDRIMWGIPSQNKMGRIPKALSLFHRFEAELLLFGGGGMRHPLNGEDLAGELASYMENCWNNYEEFSEFQGCHLGNLHKRFLAALDLSLRSSTTREEVAGALSICEKRGIDHLILVSSPSHSPRCLRDADGLRLENPAWQHITVMAISSDVYFDGGSADKTVILEQPYRTDSPTELHGFHRFALFITQRFLGETAEGKRRILAACESLELPDR